MTEFTPEIEKQIGGLKKEIGRQSYFKKEEMKVVDATLNALIDSWRMMLNNKIKPFIVKKMIWDYLESRPKSSKICIELNSSKLGIKTKIGTYKNKKGVESECHYTIHNHYYGSVKKLGKEPVYYDGRFLVDEKYFSIDLEKLMTIQKFNGVYLFEHIFIPILPVEELEEGDLYDIED